MAKQNFNHLNRSDRAKHKAKLGDLMSEVMKNSGIVAKASGTNFVINDSADAPIEGLKIYGRTDQVKTTGANLFDVFNAEYIKSKTYTEVSSDGTLKVASNVNGSYQSVSFPIHQLTVPETIYISLKARMGTDKTVPLVRVRYKNSESGAVSTIYGVTELTQEWRNIEYKLNVTEARLEEFDTLDIIVYSNNSSTAMLKDEAYVELKDIMISKTGAEYEPYTGLAPSPSPEYPQALKTIAEGGSVGVDVYGKNLFNINDVYKTTHTDYRVEDNKLIIKKTNPNTNSYSNIFFTIGKCKDFSNKTLTVSITNESNNIFSTHFVHAKDGTVHSNAPICRLGTVGANKTTVITGTIPDNYMDAILCLRIVSQSTTVTDEEYTLSHIQVEYGTEATEYKPFIKKTATFSTPNGLRGIPVESGGNYTDESGQQWVCDEIDVKNREFIVRIAEEIFDGNEGWMRHDSIANAFWLNNVAPLSLSMIMCEKYKGVLYERNPTLSGIDKVITCRKNIIIKDTDYSATQSFVASLKANPLKIQYILKEPIRIKLSNEQILAFRTLESYKPSTRVSSESGVFVKLSYYADKKNYIDQKFAELMALALEN